MLLKNIKIQKIPYRLYIDTGGTFTDCIAVTPDENIVRKKILSNGCLRGTVKRVISLNELEIDENWDIDADVLGGYHFSLLVGNDEPVLIRSYDFKKKRIYLKGDVYISETDSLRNFAIYSGEEAPLMLARMITATNLNSPLPPIEMRLASTKGTNALLEKKGAEMVLIVTSGFKDIMNIGNQQRPDIFSLNVEKPDPLCRYVIEVDERVNSNGEIIRALNSSDIETKLTKYLKKGVKVAAVALLNAYQNPDHEIKIGKLLRQTGFQYVSLSTELGSKIKYLQRTETAVVNAYLSPVIGSYIDSISKNLNGKKLLVMNSAGGLVNGHSFHPKDSLLSGPAGGVVGASAVSRELGVERFISFDMGGTSTDVSRFDSDFDYSFELEVGGAHINSPTLSIETVAAGGGSLCFFDGYRIQVGPESAGASPGPSCYGAGGPLCITDVNLLLGRLDVTRFGIPVSSIYPEKELENLVAQVERSSGESKEKEELLTGFIRIANEHMADAIKKISIAKGYDPSKYALIAFGGAGGLHACEIADILNIKKVLLPSDAGLLSAYGLGEARVERFAEQQFLCPLTEIINQIPEIINRLGNVATKKLITDSLSFNSDEIRIRLATVSLRFKGQENCLEIPFTDVKSVTSKFKERYISVYGHWTYNRDVEVESVRVIASFSSDKQKETTLEPMIYLPEPHHFKKALIIKAWQNIPVFTTDHLKPGALINGPALLLDKHSTCLVQNNWELKIDSSGTGVLERKRGKERDISKKRGWTKEIELEIFTNRFMSIAENMGAMLERTSLSVNIKERQDYSCALIDPNGELVANAPHIPVHLGSLGLCVRTLRDYIPMEPGDTIVTNHPKFGGSHLPDITVVTPVYTKDRQLLAYVVNRAHHAEIGGARPGSMPPGASCLAEEGVVIKPFHLVRNGEVNWEQIKKILNEGEYPSRSIDENIADLNAALAANRSGEKAVLDLVNEQGAFKVLQYMDYLKTHAENKMKDTLNKIPEGIYSATEYLDDGTPLMVNIKIVKSECTIDFTGSSGVHQGNLNGTQGIVNSVVIYVLRLLLAENIPLNDGILKPVRIIIPKGILNPDFPDDYNKCPAVVGGNVELSQRLVDTILKAFGVVACSQGTMNNLLFGNDKYSYYETICGGCGAGNGFHGRSAVHHHMTNTRITDPEILELRYPVQLLNFEIRKGSGGMGAFNGGDGVTRELLFTENTSLSLISQHRNYPPYGLKGGQAGKKGKQYIIKKSGESVQLNGIDSAEVNPGDKLVIKTPGGGGYGKPLPV